MQNAFTKFLLVLLLFTGTMGVKAQITVTGCTGAGNGSYTTLGAAITAIGTAQPAANIIITVTASTTEGTGTISIGAGTWATMTISPSGGSWIISAATTAGLPMISLNGADNVTIDGLNSGGNALTIQNTTRSATSGTSTIRFQSDATNNVITNCTILGSANMPTGTDGGNIWFGSGAVSTGNDGNMISNCNIGPVGVNLPTKGIYFSGTSNIDPGTANSGITINNNNIFDYSDPTVTSAGIDLNSGTVGTVISNNRFYQTASRTLSNLNIHSGIRINNTSGGGYQITGNTIGYASSTSTGIYTLVLSGGSGGKFHSISLNVGNATATSVQGNIITAIGISGATGGTGTSSPFIGVLVTAGITNIGNLSGNTIGSQSATGSISYSYSNTDNAQLYGIYNASSSNWIVENNSIGGISASGSSSSEFSLFGIRLSTTSASSSIINNNTIGGTVANSMRSLNANAGTKVQGILTSSNGAVTVSNNTIRNLSAAGGTGTGTSSSVIGICITSPVASQTLLKNTIYNLSNSHVSEATTVTGIQVNSGTSNVVESNYIYNVTSSTNSIAAAVNGIQISGGITTFRNNMIAIGAGMNRAIGTGSTSGGVNGINETLGTNNFYHNSVYMGGTPTAGAGPSYAFKSTQTAVSRNFMNNIFFNARSNSGATGKNYAVTVGGTAVNPAGLTINNNVYFTNGTGAVFGYFNSLDVASFAAWKTAVGQDASSFNSDPQYLDPANALPDLHINPAIATVVELNGADLGVALDYDGQTRTGLTPVDIGADAGNFTGSDQIAPDISAITQTGNLCNLTSFTVTAQLYDVDGVDNSGFKPRIYFRKNAGAYFSSAGTLTAGTVNSGTWTFTITYATVGGVIAADVIDYFIVAQDVSVTPHVGGSPSTGLVLTDVLTVTTPPSTPLTYSIVNTLTGTYTVGSGGNFTTLTAAVASYNSSCLGGAVVFELLDASYTTPAEVFPITINVNAYASSTNTLTIRPATGVTATISGSSATSLLKLNGADYIIIDGSNNGSNTKDLTVSNTSTAANTAAIWFSSLGTGAGATNNTIKNCNIRAGNIGTAANTFGIHAGGAAITTSGTGDDNDALTIHNNTINKTYYGIYAQATSTGVNNNLTITGNTIGAATASDYVTFRGLLVSQADNAVVRQNTIFNMISGETAIIRAMDFGTGVTNTEISRNTIYTIQNSTTTGFRSGQGITVNTANPANMTIANNVIYGLKGHGNTTMTDNVLGIAILGGGGYAIYFNSVNISDNMTASTSIDNHAGLYIAAGVTNLNLRNNVFSMTATSGHASGKTYGIYCLSANTAFTTINYNDYYAPGTSNRFAGFIGSDRTTLANIQSGFGQNVNSLVTDPQFNSNTLLIPMVGSPVVGIGDNSTGVAIDILGVSRSAAPTIGAYESPADFVAPVINYTPLAPTYLTGDRLLTATISDASGVPVTGTLKPRIYYKKRIGGAWFSSAGNLTGGSATNGTWSFTIFAADMGGVVIGDTIYYYVIAQDLASPINISSNPSAGLVATDVNTVTTPPTSPSNYLLEQVTVIIDITTNTTPNLASSYPSLASALTALNGVTAMSGPVTLTCIAGSETVPATGLTIGSTSLNPVLSSTNTITINKSGGAVILNAGVGMATPASAIPDGILKIAGADWITIDGLTFTDGNVTNPATMEFGIGLFKAGTTDGARNNTIQNCIFNMQRVNNAIGAGPMVEGSVGILVVNSTATTATTSITPASAAGTNSGNKFYSNTINGGNYGIVLNGFAATSPFTLGDTGNDIGGSTAVTGNLILNYGGASGATNPAAAIRANNQWSINISHNTINNNNGSGVNHTNVIRGIYAQAGTSANATINFNTITLKIGATTSTCTAIENTIGSTAASNTININNNTIENCTYATATTGSFNAILVNTSAANVNINSNTVTNNTQAGTGTFNAIFMQSTPVTVTANNNIITNNSKTVTGTLNGISTFTGSTSNVTANSNTITGNTVNGGASAGSFLYGIHNAFTNLTASGNTITNNSIPSNSGSSNAEVIGYRRYAGGVSNGNEIITGNNISNLFIGGNSSVGANNVSGIYSTSNPYVGTSTSVKSYSDNMINNLAYTGTSGSGIIYGIFDDMGGTINVNKNKIYALSSTGANSVCIGMYFSTSVSSVNITNNYIGDLSTPAGSLTLPIRGISIGSASSTIPITADIRFNSIYINATSNGTNFGSTAIYSNTSYTNLTLRNNIFVNLSTPNGTGVTSVYRRENTILNTYSSSSDNNLFYAGTPGANRLIFYDGTNSDQTITSYKARMGDRDIHSVTENPVFLSTTGSSGSFLHIDPSVPTQIESGGISIAGVTDDFDGDTRNSLLPDIGADEGTFIMNDLVGPVITYTPLSSTCNTGARTLNATIFDASGVPVSGPGLPVLYWKINNNTYASVTGSFVSGNTYQFSFGAGVGANDTVRYYIVAQDQAGIPNVTSFSSGGASGFTVNPPAVSTPPANPSSYTINILNGSYNVGTGGHFATLTAAIAAYHTHCLGGPVIFQLTKSTYNTAGGEIFPIVINDHPDASAVNTLTIKPSSSVISTITGSNNIVLFKINGGDYITIDGSNNGTNSKNLTLENTFAGPTVIFWIASTAAGGATNNTIRNCILKGESGSNTEVGVMASGSTKWAPAEQPNTNLVIQNNTCIKSVYGVFVEGNSGGQTGCIIRDNTIGSLIAGENIGYAGIDVGNCNGAIISNNNIFNILSIYTQPKGINIRAGVTNSVLNANRIDNVKYTGASSPSGAKGIDVNTDNASSNVRISNNMISNMGGYGGSALTGNSIVGIRIGASGGTTTNTGGINLYYNTVNLAGSFAGHASGTESAALFISSTASNLDVRNNILMNSLNNSNSAVDKSWSVNSAAANTVFAVINNNNYHVSGGAGIFGFLGGDITTLSNWQAATLQDANSLNVLPVFAGAADLHLTAANAVLKAGTTVAGITADFDNNARNLGLPTMGADEIYIPNLWSGMVSTVWDGATTANWDDGVVPSMGANVTIPFGVPNMPAIAATTSINNLSFIGTGATLSLNGQNLQVGGTITGSGTLTGSPTSNLDISGTTALNFTQTNALTRSLNNLTLQGGGPANATLGNALDVYGTIQLDGGATLNMDGHAVTLKSNPTNTARIANLTGQTLTGATNVTMERFIKLRAGGAGRAYRLLTPTVNTSGSIKINWMENGMNTVIGVNDNPLPGYGTHITGAAGNNNGFDVTQSNAPSLYNAANGVTPTYTAISSTAGTLNAKTGYFMYIRGDRSVSTTIPLAPGMPTTSTTLRATGALLQGTQTTFTNTFIGGGALNLVTNPYPSPIDWSLVQPACTGITGSYTYWDANIGTRGGFATVTTTGLSTPATSATQFIQSGQAFFVESDGAVPAVNIQEGHKSAGNNNGVFLVAAPPVESFRTELYVTEPNGFRRITDGVLAVYDDKYSAVVDANDAKEINNWDENIAIARDGKRLAIEARPVINKSDDLPIFMNNMKKQAYEFEFTPLVFTNTHLKAELVDNFLGIRTLLSVTDPTVVSFTVTTDQASAATDRFKVVFGAFGSPHGVDEITIKASQQNDGVMVDWTAKTETDMVRYEVERSAYGTAFLKVNNTAALGNSSMPVNYQWFDTRPERGTNFYRIKGIDKAGNIRYSDMVRVLFGQGEPAVVIYPNPVEGNTFKIDMYNVVQGSYLLHLYSINGQLVHTEQWQHDGSQATRTITLKGDLAKGVYQLQLRNENGFKTTKRFIKN